MQKKQVGTAVNKWNFALQAHGFRISIPVNGDFYIVKSPQGSLEIFFSIHSKGIYLTPTRIIIKMFIYLLSYSRSSA